MAVARHQSAVVRHSAGVARRLEASCDGRHTTIRIVARHHCHTTPKPPHDTTVTRRPEASWSCGDSRMTPRGVARRHRHTTLWGVTRRRCGSVMHSVLVTTRDIGVHARANPNRPTGASKLWCEHLRLTGIMWERGHCAAQAYRGIVCACTATKRLGFKRSDPAGDAQVWILAV